ncbi:MAG: response regulator [candidate division Zixibacteria bacterium]|nr:response regulator [candidate division Zixibacteria bacterium]
MLSESRKETGAKILVVDDEPLVVELLQRVLTRIGHTVVVATSGKEALDKALEARPDLIFMDVIMPEGDGYQATVHIKRHPLLQDIPVIFLTGQTIEEDRGRSFATGGAIHLRKPFTDSQIRDVVNLVLRTAAHGNPLVRSVESKG